MATRPLVFFPDPKLFEQSAHISHISDKVKALAVDLLDTMKQFNGAGLAAIQVGEAARMFAIIGEQPAEGDKEGEPFVMVNPVWSPAETYKDLLDEGCLSFPGIKEQVERFEEVNAIWTDLDGVEHGQTFTGLQAQVIQHETEHLDGHTFLDLMDIVHRDRIRMQVKQRARLMKRIETHEKRGQHLPFNLLRKW